MKDQIFIIEDCMGVAQGFAPSIHAACLVMDELDATRPEYHPHEEMARLTEQVAFARDHWVRACLKYDDDPSHWQRVTQVGPMAREWLEHIPTGKRVEFVVTVTATTR